MSSSAYVLGLVVAIATVAILSLVFFWEIVSLVVNVAILYLVIMRVWYKFKQNDFFQYIVGIAAGAVIILLVGNVFPFWRITNIAIVGVIIAEVIYWFPNVNMPKRRRKKRS